MPDIITTAAASRRERYGISNNHDNLFLMGYLGKEWNVLTSVVAIRTIADTLVLVGTG